MTARDRKKQILNACLELLAKEGLASVTHRAVDKTAGLSPGSTSYYFSKKTALIEAAAIHLAELLDEDCADVQRAFAQLIADGKKDEAIAYVANDLVAYADEKRELLLARLELTLAGSRSDELKLIADQLSAAARQPIEFFLKLISDECTEEQVVTSMGLLDGIALLYATGQGPKPTVEQVERIFLSAS